MTPSYLQRHATISGPCTLTPQYLEISPTTGDVFQHALKILTTDCVGITVTVAFDKTLAVNDHDPFIGISDGVLVNGIFTDQPAYITPINGESGRVLGNRITAGNQINAQKYPSEIKMQFKPSENWGSVYGNDYTTIGNYQNSLDLTKGLYLELYRNHAPEKYHIRYITVDVRID